MQKLIYGVQLELDEEQRHLFNESMINDELGFVLALPYSTDAYQSFIYLVKVESVINARLSEISLSFNDLRDILVLCCGLNENLGDFRNHNLINTRMKNSLEAIVDKFISDGAPVDFGDGVRTIGEYGWHLINTPD